MKDYIKRLFKYILYGIPIQNVRVSTAKINYGEILLDKNILVTGGNSGIGYEIAKRCSEEGANVLIIGRNKDKLVEAAKKIKKCKYLQFDLENINQLDSMYNKAESIIGGNFDCIVLNAGVSYHEKNIEDVTIKGFEDQIRLNLESTYFLSKLFISRNKFIKSSNMLIVSSERGFQCDDVPYGLSKAALNSLTKGIAKRYYRDGIRINAIAPGITTSNMTKMKNDDNLYVDRISSGRAFLASEIAEVAVFLLSDSSKCISGEVIACDAGNYISSYF